MSREIKHFGIRNILAWIVLGSEAAVGKANRADHTIRPVA
jgi:hypothetical protein